MLCPLAAWAVLWIALGQHVLTVMAFEPAEDLVDEDLWLQAA